MIATVDFIKLILFKSINHFLKTKRKLIIFKYAWNKQFIIVLKNYEAFIYRKNYKSYYFRNLKEKFQILKRRHTFFKKFLLLFI